MEFGEKLQELRKEKGLTQEELAESLYVSRTAVSKWESGRGYPSIDSLKEISAYFSVSIDELLSGEKLISLAERENGANIRRVCDGLLGMADVLALMLIVLPLYPMTVDGQVYAVSLPMYQETAAAIRAGYWAMDLLLVMFGLLKTLPLPRMTEKRQNAVTACSMIAGVIAVLALALTRAPYAVTVAFLLLIVKGTALLKAAKAG